MSTGPHAPDPARAGFDASVTALVQALAAMRPAEGLPPEALAEHVQRQVLQLCDDPVRLERLRTAVRQLLALPGQQAFFAEAGLHSALGFARELAARIGQGLLPLPPDGASYSDAVRRVIAPGDHRWLAQVADESWLRLLGRWRRPPGATTTSWCSAVWPRRRACCPTGWPAVRWTASCCAPMARSNATSRRSSP
jgi:site-specific recombinase